MRFILMTAVALLALSPAPGEDATKAPQAEPPPAPDFGKLVEDLGNPSFTVREQASAALGEAGESARPSLEKAVQSKDPEVQVRARTLLDGLDAKRRAKAKQDSGEEDGVGDPTLRLQEQMLKNLRRQMGQVQIMQVQQGNANIRMSVNLNGKQIQLDQDDLAKLEALKGHKIEALGLSCSKCPEELADQLKIAGGVLVRNAEDKAEGVALEKHDLIVAAAGAAVTDPEALEKLLGDSAGKPLELTVYRKGEKKAVTVTPPKP